MAETVKKKTPAKKPSTKTTETKPRKTAPGKKAEAPSEPEMPVSRDRVAQLAHRFWAERGRQHGHHVEDWLRAEQELRKMAS